jgi:hypothetical protein
MPAPDPWSAFLEWLTTVMVPNWGELISMLPLFVILGLLGPIVTLVVIMWAWHLLTRRRGRVRTAEPEAVAAPRGEDGRPAIPPNVPYCADHALLHPPRSTACEVDGGELQVACPVDGTVRPAAVRVCSVCGTRYELGAGAGPLTVRRPAGPPEGGAAAA